MLNDKKGIHGIGVLFLLIALILIAVGTSAVVLSNANKLREEGFETYRESHNNFKSFQVVDVSGYDGRNGTLNRITIDAKLIGDSMPLDLAHLTLSIGEEDYRTFLKYRGDGSPMVINHSGYITWSPEEFGQLVTGTDYALSADMNDDEQVDYFRLNSTHVIFIPSNSTTNLTYPLGVDLSAPSVTINFDELITNGERYGTLTISGTTTAPNTIDESMTFNYEPYHNGGGYFVTEHLIRARSSRNGYMIPGDVVRFYVETYRDVDTDEILDILFIYRSLESVSKRVYVGNTFPHAEKVTLFPKP